MKMSTIIPDSLEIQESPISITAEMKSSTGKMNGYQGPHQGPLENG